MHPRNIRRLLLAFGDRYDMTPVGTRQYRRVLKSHQGALRRIVADGFEDGSITPLLYERFRRLMASAVMAHVQAGGRAVRVPMLGEETQLTQGSWRGQWSTRRMQRRRR